MGNRVCPSQQVQDWPNDQVFNTRYKHRNTTKWIPKDIKANMCRCGKNQEKNVSNFDKQQNKNGTEGTNYFGEITFDTKYTAKYIRVHSTTNPDTVLTRMNEKWKLEIPDLLIYVHDSMNSLANKYQTSLTKAVQGTGAWIITDGKQEYVNTDETADEQPIIIGISQLDNQQGTWPAEMTSLDPHHSHFILIDDGSGDTRSTTRNFWKKLEKEITKKKKDNGVSIVLILQVDDKKKHPAVIVKTFEKKASGTKHQSDTPEDISTSKLTHICEGNVDSCDFDLGLDILQALLKDANNKEKNTSHQYHLKLFEIAKNTSIDRILQEEDILKSCMVAAILLDKVEYVKMILDNDFDLKTFLTYEKLEELYNTQFEGSLFKEVLPNMRKSTDRHKEPNIEKELTKLLNDVRESKPHLRYLDQKVMKKRCCCLPIACCTSTKDKKQSDQPDDENPWLDLFVWSVLNDRKDMAKLFWRRGKDAIAAALFADAILYAMSNRIDDKSFKDNCEKHRREFTNLAIGVLKECHKDDVKKTKDLLVQQFQWCETSCVLIAVNAKNKQFLSEYACQDVFNNIWMGKLDEDNGSLLGNLKLLLCILIPPLILTWISFKDDDQAPVPTSSEQTEPNSRQPTKEPTTTSNNSKTIQDTNCCRSICQRIKSFYLAPVIIFFHNVISYIIFLGLYSYILICKFDRYLSWQEIVLCVWVFTIFTQEVIQVCTTPPKDWSSRLYNYIRDGWNILDVITVFLFLFGMILRIVDHPQVAESAHIVLGVNMIAFYMRLLHIFSVHRELGPKLVMIMHMVYNLAYFIMILLVFIVAYGIASHAILYPHTEPSLATLTEIFRRPYWNIYGELMLDKIEGSVDCTNDPALYNSGSFSRCPTESGKYFVPLLMGVYMLMCNILLLNLLIAMFSFTFQKDQDNSYMYWRYQQYSLINEYANRPFLAPPLIIFVHIWWLIRCVTCRKIKCCEVNADEQNAFLQPRQDCKDLREWENKMAERINKQVLEHKSNPVSEAVSPNLENKMDNIEKKLNEILTKLSEINQGPRC